MKNAEKDVEIAVGVMSALAVLLSAVEAWSWSKRYRKSRYQEKKYIVSIKIVQFFLNTQT